MFTWERIWRRAASMVLVLVCGASGLLVSRAGAQDAPSNASSSGAASTGPAATTLKPDLSSPLATYRSMKAAIKAADAGAFAATYRTASADEARVINAAGEMFAAIVELRQAAEKQFGAQAAQDLPLWLNAEPSADATEYIEGDRAVLLNVGGPRPMELVRDGEDWKITYDSFVANNFHDLPKNSPATLAEVFEASAEMYGAIRDEVQSRQLATADDVAGAIQLRRQAMMKTILKKPTTQPQTSADALRVVKWAAPVVVQTIPSSGSVDVDPNLTELRATFSKPMQDGNWSWVQTGKETFPETTGSAHYLPDGRTCVLPVKLEPGKGYVIWLNKAPYESFMDTEGRRAVPYMLVFATRQ